MRLRYQRADDKEYKYETVDDLLEAIYEENYSHIDFIDNMNGGDCDCNLHQTIQTIVSYMEEEL